MCKKKFQKKHTQQAHKIIQQDGQVVHGHQGAHVAHVHDVVLGQMLVGKRGEDIVCVKVDIGRKPVGGGILPR